MSVKRCAGALHIIVLAGACASLGSREPEHADLGCGSAEVAARGLKGARASLFPDPIQRPQIVEHAELLRRTFYPSLSSEDPIYRVVDPAECRRVLNPLAEQWPNYPTRLRAQGDTLRGGVEFAILSIGPYYHFTVQQIFPPEYVITGGGASFIAPKQTLKFNPVAMQQF